MKATALLGVLTAVALAVTACARIHATTAALLSPLSAAKLGSASPGHPWMHMPVQTPSGGSLGTVSNVVPALNGQKDSGYVVIAVTGGSMVAVPDAPARVLARAGKLIVSKAELDHAPTVTQGELRSPSDKTWRVAANRYWDHIA
jgi:hypothetical protein